MAPQPQRGHPILIDVDICDSGEILLELPRRYWTRYFAQREANLYNRNRAIILGGYTYHMVVERDGWRYVVRAYQNRAVPKETSRSLR